MKDVKIEDKKIKSVTTFINENRKELAYLLIGGLLGASLKKRSKETETYIYVLNDDEETKENK